MVGNGIAIVWLPGVRVDQAYLPRARFAFARARQLKTRLGGLWQRRRLRPSFAGRRGCAERRLGRTRVLISGYKRGNKAFILFCC